MDCNEVKSRMSLEEYHSLFDNLGMEILEETNNYLLFYQYDRYSRSEVYSHKKKLYFYTSNFLFKNYISGDAFDIFGFVKRFNEVNGVSKTFPEIVQQVSEYASTKVVNKFSYGSLKKYTKTLYVPSFKVYDKRALNFMPKEPPADWLAQGISEEVCREYNIRQYPRLSQIVIPVYVNGEMIGARVRNNRPDLIESEGKYHPLRLLNGKMFNFSTNGCLYGLDNARQAIHEYKSAILVEGEKAVLQAKTKFGDDNIAVAMFGKSMSAYKRKLLKEAGAETIYYCADADFDNSIDRQEWLSSLKRFVQPLLADGFNVFIVADWNRDILDYKDNIFDCKCKDDFGEIWSQKIKM